MNAFLERLKTAPTVPILADGAMGTMLAASGAPLDAAFDTLNIDDPARVMAIHRAYLAAGAELIETNTFSANRFKLHDAGGSLLIESVNRAGVELARTVIAEFPDRKVWLAGAVGPLGVRLAPYGRIKRAQAADAFREQITALVKAGVDLLIFETFTDLNEIEQAVLTAREVAPEVPIIASMTFTRDARTVYGDTPRDVADKLAASGADVIGVNCANGPSQIARIARAMRTAQPDKLMIAMPNAGYPEEVGGRMMYPATPEYFAEYGAALRDLGVSIIGGCCGTTPAHIAAIRAALDTRQPSSLTITIPDDDNGSATTAEQPTELARKLAAGRFVTTVEMSPPRAYNAAKSLASAQLLQEAGVDTIDVADSPRAQMRMSPWALCHLIQAQVNMETILHFPTRGRNLLRVQGDLLAAHALGIRNIFVVMGDPTNIGDYPQAHDNYDVVPSGLIKLIKQNLNAGIDQAGNSIGQPTSFLVGCALNMGAQDLDKECQTLVKKIESGADFALTQSIYDPRVPENFIRHFENLYGTLRLPLLAGILPLYSSRHAAFLHNEVPGIDIPDAIRERIDAAGEKASRVGIEIAQTLLNDLIGLVQGAYLIPPYHRYEMAAEIIDGIKVAR
jgi:methionine synthase / methylenetetrahydrofolate reductase(NADPH)